ncbi:MAG: head GIN domain-containing protein [Nonlabens sp.]
MKKVLTVCLMMMGIMMNAQEERLIGDFDTVKVFDLINVTMIQATTNKIVISGKNSDDVQVVQRDDILKIRMQLDEQFDGNDTQVTLYYVAIKEIDANEGAVIEFTDTIKQDMLTVEAQEGANIQGDVDVEILEVRAVTGGIVELSGKAANQDISVYTGGIVNNRALKSKNTDASVRAGGEVELYATDYVDLKTRAGGAIHVYGDPKEVDKSRILGGKIIMK